MKTRTMKNGQEPLVKIPVQLPAGVVSLLDRDRKVDGLKRTQMVKKIVLNHYHRRPRARVGA